MQQRVHALFLSVADGCMCVCHMLAVVVVLLVLVFFVFSFFQDGKVCISILHEAKADEFNQQEKMSEKWRPILGVEAVLVSVLSMLGDANFESPANIDASVELKNDPKAYKARIRKLVRDSMDAL